MSELPPYEIREYRAGDEEAILETFNRCFADVDPNFTPRTIEEWRWQYLENPSGWRIYLAITDDGRVMSQYAGVGLRVLLEGERAHFSQAVDSMTDPAFRRGLKKPGFFVLTSYPYAENYGGPAPDKDPIQYGMPIPPAWRIGKVHCGYQMLRTETKLVVPADGGLTLESAAGVEVTETETWPDDLDELFARACEPFGAIGIRDRAHMQWRYRDRPGFRYEVALARANGQLVGLAVWRAGVFDRSDDGLICDWIVDPGRPDASAALIAWAAERTRAAGRERLVTLLPDTCPEWLPFQGRGFRARTSSYFMVIRRYTKRYDTRWVYKHWYYTLGDTDLV
ncbi:GNAT family N-acetyltransferase [Engelhardtia mirabilis]|uniref:Uncharacterized protein n=1 Tax=Engelhardtia mirabilis TaxID=2528011 RepID=A0A518BN73_9BACT|nr:hypothetical protein Pla133_35030 [Planctomycetes bacterium Pla133]QDV02732.1 hypothetical protein Pla86_35010 [Planctomycetes bacterium Pla86]